MTSAVLPQRPKKHISLKAPSQGKIEQISNFSLDESTMLPVWHERTYEIKLTSQVTKKIFHFFLFSKQMTVNDRLSAATRINAATE